MSCGELGVFRSKNKRGSIFRYAAVAVISIFALGIIRYVRPCFTPVVATNPHVGAAIDESKPFPHIVFTRTNGVVSLPCDGCLWYILVLRCRCTGSPVAACECDGVRNFFLCVHSSRIVNAGVVSESPPTRIRSVVWHIPRSKATESARVPFTDLECSIRFFAYSATSAPTQQVFKP